MIVREIKKMSANEKLVVELNERFGEFTDVDSVWEILDVYDNSSDLEEFLENVEFMGYLDDDDDIEDLWGIIRNCQ